MDEYHDSARQRTSEQERPPRKLWTAPRLARMGSVSEVTSKVGVSTHRDSTNQKNRTF